MKDIRTTTLVSIAQIFFWGSLILSHVLAPTVLRSQTALSMYAALPETFPVIATGTTMSAVLTWLIATRINPVFRSLIVSLKIVAVSSLLLLFFRLQAGEFAFQVHGVLSGILFTSLMVGIMSTLRKAANKANNVFFYSAVMGAGVLVLSTGEVGVLNLLPYGQIIVFASYSVWLQFNVRRADSRLII